MQRTNRLVRLGSGAWRTRLHYLDGRKARDNILVCRELLPYPASTAPITSGGQTGRPESWIQHELLKVDAEAEWVEVGVISHMSVISVIDGIEIHKRS